MDSIYIHGHPTTSILSAGMLCQASGNRRRQCATLGLCRRFSTSPKLSVFAGNVWKIVNLCTCYGKPLNTFTITEHLFRIDWLHIRLNNQRTRIRKICQTTFKYKIAPKVFESQPSKPQATLHSITYQDHALTGCVIDY